MNEKSTNKDSNLMKNSTPDELLKIAREKRKCLRKQIRRQETKRLK